MHDLVEEMAHYIVRGAHPNHPEKHSRIWKREDIAYLCDMGVDAPPMETEALVFNRSIFDVVGLSDVVANMKKLRWIRFDNYLTSSFPSNFQPRELGYLELKESLQKELWHGYKSLPNLKILDLTNSSKLITTPDFDGLPCLERLILDGCKSLEEIHPSIGYHKRLVYVDMSKCSGLKSFPPIIQMQMLETLILSKCHELQEFPDIQSNMSLPNLKILDLSYSRNLIKTPDFEGLPCLERLILACCNSLEEIHPSIGYHKRLVFGDMSYCKRLKRFPPIIQMQMLETLDLSYCTKLQQFPDIQSNMYSLVTLDLRHTGIEIIPPSVGRLPGLKFLNLSYCKNLVELPDLPSSIAILKADGCDSLEIVRDLSYYKWLWKVSLGERTNKRVLLSMLEGNAANDRFMSVLLPAIEPSPRIFMRLVTLQLPSNWHSDFSGLLLFLCDDSRGKLSYRIDIKQETSTYDYSRMKSWEQCKYERVGYVPFNSLRHIPWLNPTYTKNISFQTNLGGLSVELVRSKNKIVDLNENPIDYSECWDEEYDEYEELRKTFEIMYDSQSSNIRIVWRH
ncbi:putative leucine-rich repeat domain superfamily [Helianthus annuus]|nr:putative leucine-rich repeat domain superfamily [Helianthus annuus]KAJ0720982.1 putative leucine-rich repeat domain superfamily [Helianthus annuus]